MTLTRYKLGDLIKQHNERCANRSVNRSDISGVNRDKEFFPSRQVGSDVSNYKVVPAGYFACNLMHVGRDIVLPIAYNRSNHEVYVSPAYTVFYIKKDAPIDAIYLEMWFKSDERDRYFWMHTDSSIRDGMTYDDMCDIDIDLPSIEIQKKYVDIYKSMLDNQKCYERGLEDLKLTCDAFIEELRRKYPCEKVGPYLELRRVKNYNNAIDDVYGVSTSQTFITASSTVDRSNLSNYKIVEKYDIAYVPTTHMKVWAVAISDKDKPFVVSPIYEVFRSKDFSRLNPEYFFLWLCRDETIRYAFYNSWGSARENFAYEDMCDIEIPVPDIKIQNSVAHILKAYSERRIISEKMKEHTKDICRILIKGSLEEANK